MNTVTITFRAKRDEFAGGIGYKVPALKPSHLTFTQRDTVATLITTARDIGATLGRYYKLPAVIWEDNTDSQWKSDTSEWTIRPLGNGFMAECSTTVELTRR